MTHPHPGDDDQSDPSSHLGSTPCREPRPAVGADPVTARSDQDESDLDERVLAFEADWQAGRLRGDKETLIRERLGMSSPRYHLQLNRLVDDPRANLDHPVLLARLGRIRERRREARSTRGRRR